MSADYKPGDLAMLTWSINRDGPLPAVRGEGRWHMLDHLDTFDREFLSDEWLEGVSGVTIRPLVTLEFGIGDVSPIRHREYVLEILRQPCHSWLNAIADQIEAQTKPPKPPEPTGLGAVVQDSDGMTWVRRCLCGLAKGSGAADWSPVGEDRLRGWRELDVVRVLSEGVQP